MKMQVLAMLQRYRLVSHLRLYLKAKKNIISVPVGKKEKNKTPFISSTFKVEEIKVPLFFYILYTG